MTRTNRFPRAFSALAVAGALALGLSACGADEQETGTGDTDAPIKIGVVNSADDQWTIFQEKAEAAGIAVDVIDLGDYTLPNPALTQGELDLNQFQHLQFLAEYNVNSDEDLTPIGATAVYPLSLFSTKHDSVDDIPEGAEIAIPNDPTNLARALLVLQEAGLIELADGGSSSSTEADVLDSSRVSVIPVDATQTATNLESIDGAVVNNDFIKDASLDPENALFSDNAESEGALPYINVWVSRAEDKDNETFHELVEISHDAEVEAALQEAAGGSAFIANQDEAELADILAGIEDSLRNG
ncbi:MetQ/NlpA family ABC transporter substrate-binding protein [Sanguibacter antarcticus]|uniref:D-methionine transport system substrate-binding protein n=1 Tax=Sanguibacter antarcticus TaxID=372484 RepID=A0A2A9E5N3_9MICO|nr:MetQ/NlpA family ABC transporter substrate-binding protein [Sanguibacter antarcticus]PFG34357.1 D-methionine transport system substrate-binding protein [Sanguibacter antarcticus]